MWLWLLACEPIPDETCELFDPGEGCEIVEICCDLDGLCAYVTSTNRYECLSRIDCSGAVNDMLCEACSHQTPYGAWDLGPTCGGD